MENSVFLKSIPLVFGDHGTKLLKVMLYKLLKTQIVVLILGLRF